MIGPPAGLAPYPFARLAEQKAELAQQGVDLIDFGIGDPLDATPDFIHKAVGESITAISSYPKAAGLPELRASIAAWIARRFGVKIDANSAVIPTLGSKEIIHSLAAYVGRPGKNLIGVPSPAYPVYERGARFHGFDILHLPLPGERSFLPDLDAVDPQTWERVALLWLNYPNNPTGAIAPLSMYEQAADLARRYDFVLASDEAYSEIYFDRPPTSALQLPDHDHVVVVNTLSKRSCMTGYRSGFLAGDTSIVTRLRDYRASVGVTPQDFVQRASVFAWNDDAHVTRFRESWTSKRRLMMPAFENAGITVHASATFFLWIAVPDGHSSASFAEFLLSAGVVTSPGPFFGEEGEGYVRMALVPSLDRCKQASQRLANLL